MKRTKRGLDLLARKNGYVDKFELLRDYNIIPTVKMQRHKKSEFVLLLLKRFTK